MFNKLFKLEQNNTNIQTEVVAGVTTFMTMAYIICVQPQVLSVAGMDVGSVMVATCLASAFACLLMGLLANYPIGLAPGMGENFFFAYTLVVAMGVSWEKALGMVFVSGALFIILSLVKVRELVVNAIPNGLKQGIAVGIGLFIAFIGFIEAGIVARNPGAIVMRGNFGEPPVLLAILGLFIVLILLARKIKGAILIGMLVTAFIGVLMGVVDYRGVVSRPPSISPTFWKFDIMGLFRWEYVVPILTLLYMDMFDTIGTLIGVSSQTGLLREDGSLPRASKALFSDAAGTVVGSICGTSTITAYVESVAGVKAGGRTGLAAIVVAVFFLLALFFSPLVRMISGGVVCSTGATLHPVTAPALIVVGAMMMWGVKKIAWDDYTEAIPAFLTIIAIPFTFSIADGIACGFITYPLMKLVSGKGRDVSGLVYMLALIFILRYIFL